MLTWRKTGFMTRRIFKWMPNFSALLSMLILVCYFLHMKIDQVRQKTDYDLSIQLKRHGNENEYSFTQADNMDTTLLVHRACKNKERQLKGNYNEKSFLEHIYLSPKYKVMFCGVEKVALTFWRRVFRVLNDSLGASPFDIHPFLAYQGEDFAHVMTLSDVSPNERQSYVRNFERFMFARDPYQRLFSAYIDKLYFPNGNYWHSLGGYIVKVYRKPFNPPYKVCGHNVTFKELVQFVIDNQKSLYYRDNHLIPIYEHCRPCEMNYTFVGKLENFTEDTKTILHKIGANNLSKVIKNNRSAAIYDLFVQDVYFLFYFRSDVSTCMNFHQSLLRFWEVMQIRGLIDSDVRMPFNEEVSKALTQEDLLRALLDANERISKPKVRQFRLTIMKEAYRTLTRSMLNELRTIFQPDCEMFGYGCTLE